MPDPSSYQERHVRQVQEFLTSLRVESGRADEKSCPVCGSYAWESDEACGYCCDCGFDVNTALSFSVTFPRLRLAEHGYGIPPNEPYLSNRDPGDETDAYRE